MERLRHFPAVLFCAFAVKMLVTGAQLVDASALLICATTFIAIEFNLRSKKDIAFEKQIKELQDSITENNKQVEQLKTHVSGLKLGTMKMSQNVR
jgi:uncharacterized protein YlxW (UPF0749 family)